jgi:hypothetical protein
VVGALVSTWREKGPLLPAMTEAAQRRPSSPSRLSALLRGCRRAHRGQTLRRDLPRLPLGLAAQGDTSGLVLMNRSYITARARTEGPTHQVLVETLSTIWSRVLWPAVAL